MNQRSKGATGERQFCKWLKENLGIDAERNLEQTRSGGADIITEHFIFEVKRVENLDVADAWRQCAVAASKINAAIDGSGFKIAVLAFRKNNRPWRFAISASAIGVTPGYIELTDYVFKDWALKLLEDRQW